MNLHYKISSITVSRMENLGEPNHIHKKILDLLDKESVSGARRVELAINSTRSPTMNV